MVIIFPVHLSCIHIHIPSKAHTYRDRQSDRQTELSSQWMIIIFPVHLSCIHIHIPSKTHTDRYTVRQADRLIFTMDDNHIPSASQLYSHSFKDRETDRQTDRQTDLSSQYMIIIFPVHLSCIHIPSKTDRQTDRQTYLHNI